MDESKSLETKTSSEKGAETESEADNLKMSATLRKMTEQSEKREAPQFFFFTFHSASLQFLYFN